MCRAVVRIQCGARCHFARTAAARARAARKEAERGRNTAALSVQRLWRVRIAHQAALVRLFFLVRFIWGAMIHCCHMHAIQAIKAARVEAASLCVAFLVASAKQRARRAMVRGAMCSALEVHKDRERREAAERERLRREREEATKRRARAFRVLCVKMGRVVIRAHAARCVQAWASLLTFKRCAASMLRFFICVCHLCLFRYNIHALWHVRVISVASGFGTY